MSGDRIHQVESHTGSASEVDEFDIRCKGMGFNIGERSSIDDLSFGTGLGNYFGMRMIPLAF